MPADHNAITSYLPHREPFMFIDSVISQELGKSIECSKTFSFNEPFFRGHFPGNPIVPGVILIETLAQASGLIFMNEKEVRHNQLVMLIGVDNFKFKKKVLPGVQLSVRSKCVRQKANFYSFEGEIFIREHSGELNLAASGIIKTALVDLQEQ